MTRTLEHKRGNIIIIQGRDCPESEWDEPKKWTIQEVLEEINRDHSDGWIDHNKYDWLDGWMEWCEGYYFRLADPEED